MAAELKGRTVGGEGKTVEVDGGYFGGYIKPANHKENRRDRRLRRNQNGKRKVVVIVRERDGNSVSRRCSRAKRRRQPSSSARVAKGTTIQADEAGSWDELARPFRGQAHQPQEAYSARRRLHQLGRGIFQPHAPRRDRPPSPYRWPVSAPLRARGVMA